MQWRSIVSRKAIVFFNTFATVIALVQKSSQLSCQLIGYDLSFTPILPYIRFLKPMWSNIFRPRVFKEQQLQRFPSRASNQKRHTLVTVWNIANSIKFELYFDFDLFYLFNLKSEIFDIFFDFHSTIQVYLLRYTGHAQTDYYVLKRHVNESWMHDNLMFHKNRWGHF